MTNPYYLILDKLLYGGPLKATEEVTLIVHVIGQAVQDCLGMNGADTELAVKLGRVGRGGWYGITHQESAKEWFRSGGHIPYADMCELEPSWITHLLKKHGVTL